MPSAWAQCLWELFLWRKLRDGQTGFALTFELDHNGGDGFIIENGQDGLSRDKLQVFVEVMRPIQLNVHRHGSPRERGGPGCVTAL